MTGNARGATVSMGPSGSGPQGPATITLPGTRLGTGDIHWFWWI